MKNPVHARYVTARNPSYWNSVYVTLRLVVFYGPYTLLTCFKPALMSLFALIGVFIAGFIRWVWVQFMYLFLGFCGYIVMIEDDDSEET